MSNHHRDPILLTPGPLTTSLATKTAMLRDWGSWDADVQRRHRARARASCSTSSTAAGTHVCVPMQGSGTFSVEAAVNTLVPRDGHVLVLINGAYGKRMAQAHADDGPQASRRSRPPRTCRRPRRTSSGCSPRDPSITHVGLIHCETSTGILNPLPEIAAVVARHGKRLIVDAMSSFGALPIDARTTPFDALVAASGKCVEGPPGMGFVFARQRRARAVRRQLARRSRSTCTTSGRTWRRRRSGASRRRRTSSSRSTRRSTSSSPKAGSRRGSRATRATARRWSTGMAELGFAPFLDPRDPGADHRHVPRARRSALHVHASSTSACATRASSSIRASSRRSRRSASAASARSAPTRCATRCNAVRDTLARDGHSPGGAGRRRARAIAA